MKSIASQPPDDMPTDLERLDGAVRARATLGESLFAELAEATHDGIGITRASYGEGENRAHELMAAAADGLGLEVAADAAGNTYMTLPGADRSAPPWVIGSHLDSVAQGGNYDGAAGVVAGLVCAAGLRDAGIVLPRDVRVMGIRAEESAWFGVSYIGSRSALGTLPEGALDTALRADTGESLAAHMQRAGCAPERLRAGEVALPPVSLHGYVELHIEQGPVLDTAGLPVGLVTGIRGNRRLPAARCVGEYSHCGGVPRSHRRDAVIATARLVAALDDIWDECEVGGQDFAFTVGKLHTDLEWHAMTKIAGETRFSIDMRSLDADFLDATVTRVEAIAGQIAQSSGVRFELGEWTRAAPGVLDPSIGEGLGSAVNELGIEHMSIASGASHDAAAFAAAGVPTAMLFVRNANGSHNPDEAMAMHDFMHGVRVLARWLATPATARPAEL